MTYLIIMKHKRRSFEETPTHNDNKQGYAKLQKEHIVTSCEKQKFV